jgi:hypothetical protein
MNSIAQYATLLPQRMNLDGEWEVGMTEFSYPVSWYNINEKQWFKMTAWSWDNNSKGFDVGEPKIYIPEGHYSSGKDVVDAMKLAWSLHWEYYRRELMELKIDVLPREEKEVVDSDTPLTNVQKATMERHDEDDVPSMNESSLRLIFGEKTHKLKCILGHESYELTFSDKLAEILSMRKERKPDELFLAGETEIDVNRGTHTIFIYCDVVQDSIVGDVKAPLLRSVIARGNYGENVREVFVKPMYVPLKSNHFDTIRIAIKSETGELVKFNYGNSCVTLHFRQVARNILI